MDNGKAVKNLEDEEESGQGKGRISKKDHTATLGNKKTATKQEKGQDCGNPMAEHKGRKEKLALYRYAKKLYSVTC